jgi:hypothetical protein
VAPPGTNVGTFVPARVLARYKCATAIIPSSPPARAPSSLFFFVSPTQAPEDGTLVPGNQIREIATRLVELICMTAEGTFVPDRERDELSAAIGTREHYGCC